MKDDYKHTKARRETPHSIIESKIGIDKVASVRKSLSTMARRRNGESIGFDVRFHVTRLLIEKDIKKIEQFQE